MNKPKTPEHVKEIWICQHPNCGREQWHLDKRETHLRHDKGIDYVKCDGKFKLHYLIPETGYIPQSKYLELETKLKIAQEALINIKEYWNDGHESAVDAIETAIEIAEEALSKLQTKEGE